MHGILVEGDSMCVYRWASDACKPPWMMADVMDEVMDLARSMNASFLHIRRSTHEMADKLAKESIACRSLFITYDYESL